MRNLVVAFALAASHGCGHAALTSTTTSLGDLQACDPTSTCAMGGAGDPVMTLAAVGAVAVGVLGLVALRHLFLDS